MRTRFLRYLLFIVFVGAINLVRGQQPDDQSLNMLDNERSQAENDIKNTEKLLKSVEQKQTAGLQTLTLIQKKIDSRKHILTTIDRQINTIQSQLTGKKEAIEMLQADLEDVKRSYSELITRYYNIQTQKSSWLMYVMASESVSQAYKRMKYIREILFLLQAQANRIVDMTNRLNTEINDMGQKQKNLSTNIEDKAREMQKLQSEENESKTVLYKLKQDESSLRKRLTERKAEYDKLNQQIVRYMREEIVGSSETSISDDALMAMNDLEQAKGYLPWPATGNVIAHFGSNNSHPVYKNIKLPDNNGVDILTQNNSEVYSIFRGVVSKVFTMQGAGLCVMVKHGSYRTVYIGLNSPAAVKEGEEIKARQKIGFVSQGADGSVLRFQIWKHMDPLNPESWLLK